MTDDERQAQTLRRRLDQELAGVRATAEARERLIRATTAQTRTQRAVWTPRRWRPVLALPLAGALVATVIAAAVVVPTFLQTETSPGVPAGGGPAPATSSAVPTAAQAPTVRPQPSPVTVLRLTSKPQTPVVGQRVILTINGIPKRPGNITVNWGDRSRNSTVSIKCADSTRPTAASADPILHSYSQAGTYRLKVTVNRCGSPADAELTITVVATPSPVSADQQR